MVGPIRAALAVASLLMCVLQKRLACTDVKTIRLVSARPSVPYLFVAR